MSGKLKVQKVDEVFVKPGRLIEVVNTNRPKFSNAKNSYIAVWVEDANGKNERCLHFTPREIALADIRAKKNPEDWPKKTKIQDLLD